MSSFHPNTDKILVLAIILVFSLIAVPAYLGHVKKNELKCMDKLYLTKEHNDNATKPRPALMGNANVTSCAQYEKQLFTKPENELKNTSSAGRQIFSDETTTDGFTTTTKTTTTTFTANREQLSFHTQTRHRYLYVLLFIVSALHPVIIFGILWNPANTLLKKLKDLQFFKRYNFLESLFITVALLSLPAMMSLAVLTCAHIDETAFSSYVKNVVFDSAKKTIMVDNGLTIEFTRFKELVPTAKGDVVLLYSDKKGYNMYRILFRAKDKDDAIKAVSIIYVKGFFYD
ncbi:MAG: hypothetical protein H7844_08345 [Nitrospirae bacterium YQR-1]